MRFASLGSGSRGNSTLVCASGAQATTLLIDCGFSRKVVRQRIADTGVCETRIDAAFVTHEHVDHTKGMLAMCEALDIPFYSSFGTAKKMAWLSHPLWRCVRADQPVNVGAFKVRPVAVTHDALEPVQFVVQENDTRLGILTDVGRITPYVIKAYQGCHALQVEANHDVDLLEKGPYPPSLRRRVKGHFGHLSNQQCADFLQRVCWPGLMRVMVGHISEKNNDAHEIRSLLNTILESLAHHVQLLEQDSVSPWCEISA